VFGVWHADETGLLAQSADDGGFFETHRIIDFCTELHGVVFQVDCVDRVAQSPKFRTLHFIGDVDEMGLLAQNADSYGVFKTHRHIRYIMC